MKVIRPIAALLLLAALGSCTEKNQAAPVSTTDANSELATEVASAIDHAKPIPDIASVSDLSAGSDAAGALGPAVEDLMQRGAGACSENTVGDVIVQIHKDAPDLKDVSDLYRKNPNRLGDQSFIYAFSASNGGFRLVFKRGTVDCPGGCADNEYWYFETDASCIGRQIGKFHLKADGQCQGQRLWRFPELAIERMCSP